VSRFALVALALLSAALFGRAEASQLVRVGGYEFPPFVEDASGSARGLTLELMAALNSAQTEYEFQFVPTSARRRYLDVVEGRLDMVFFESPEWEWAAKGLPVEFSNVILRGGELYIAPAKPGRGQEFFAELKGKRLVGILGYHYGFAGFNAEPDVLAKTWGMKLVNNHRSSIEMVLADRMDVAVVTDAYLQGYFVSNPEARQRLLVSDRYDQLYNHRVLVRKGAPITAAAINGLLAGLEKDGTLDRLWRAAGIGR